jgi:hypothetical protein
VNCRGRCRGMLQPSEGSCGHERIVQRSHSPHLWQDTVKACSSPRSEPRKAAHSGAVRAA